MQILESLDRLGGYTIGRYVREGSTGQLYLGRRIAAAGFAPTVAIKVLPPSFYASKEDSALVDSEQIASSRIDDPRVVKLEELGDDNGLRYVAMECVRGFSLTDILAFYYERDRRIRPALAVYLAMQVALGLQAAHETRDHKGNHLRIVHGSLTTKRVLVTWKGHVKLIRFGFSKIMSDEPLTSWQELFRPPEAFDLDRIDGRADVYALGAVLLASLARGGLPVLDGVIDRTAIPGSLGRAEGIPAALGDIVVSALQPRREDRPNALTFYRALVDVMPEAMKITPSDVGRELAAIRLDREFASFASERSLVGASFVPPRMTDVPSPFATTPPTASSEAAIAAERMVVPRLPALPSIGSFSMSTTASNVVREEHIEKLPPIEETPQPLEAVAPSTVGSGVPSASEDAPPSSSSLDLGPSSSDDTLGPPPPPLSSASLLPAVRVEYNAGQRSDGLVAPAPGSVAPPASAPAPAAPASPPPSTAAPSSVGEPSPVTAPSRVSPPTIPPPPPATPVAIAAPKARSSMATALVLAVAIAFGLGVLVASIVRG